MKKILLLLSVLVLILSAALSASAHDKFDYISTADTIDKDHVVKSSVYSGMVYDTELQKVYAKFTASPDISVGADNVYAQAGILSGAKLKEYPIIKIGYKCYIEAVNKIAKCDINIGTNVSRYWHNSPPDFDFTGKYAEVTIDAHAITGGDSHDVPYDDIADDTTYTYIRIKPWGSKGATHEKYPSVSTSSNDYLCIEYIALFKTLEEANEFSAGSNISSKTDMFTVKETHRYKNNSSFSMAVENDFSPEYITYLRFVPTEAGTSTDNTQVDLMIGEFGNFTIKEKPVMAIKYRTNITSSDSKFTADLGISYKGQATRLYRGSKFEYIPDGQFHTLVINYATQDYQSGDGGFTTPAAGETIWGNVDDTAPNYIRFKPYAAPGKRINENDYFDIAAVGFFATEEEAANTDFSSTGIVSNYAMRGDLNSNGIIDIADNILLSRSISNNTPISKKAGDIDGDGKITVTDNTKFARYLANWTNFESLYITPATDDYIAELDAEFDTLKESILNSESEWTLASGGTVYYVSPDGDDYLYNGKSESRPWKTTQNLTSSKLKSGDVVLFKRGGVWRRTDVQSAVTSTPTPVFTAVDGVTYSAYGTGEKPKFYGSYDAANKSLWTTTDVANVYKFTGRTFAKQSDVGCIIFNHGEAYGARIITDVNGNMIKIGHDADPSTSVHEGLLSNGLETWTRIPGSAFDYTNLSHDLEYYLDFNTGNLYLYSENKNPGERFSSIELSLKGNVIRGTNNAVFDNLCIRYGSSHGIGMSTVKNVTIRNCEVSWIGGAFQYTTADNYTRFGNGIEIYGGCDGFHVYNNYVTQCFDCGITVQWQDGYNGDTDMGHNDGEVIKQLNVLFEKNAVELSNSPLETWITSRGNVTEDTYAYMNNVIYDQNLCRGSGYGFGGYIHQKTDNNMFYGGGVTKAVMSNSFIQNNKMWKARRFIILAPPTQTNYGLGFIWKDNIIVHEPDGKFARLGANLATATGGSTNYDYNDSFFRLSDIFEVLGNNTYMSYRFNSKN